MGEAEGATHPLLALLQEGRHLGRRLGSARVGDQRANAWYGPLRARRRTLASIVSKASARESWESGLPGVKSNSTTLRSTGVSSP